MTINGNKVRDQATFDVVNPATGKVEAQAPECSPEQLDEALKAAEAAGSSWAGRRSRTA
jgi:acyl-CoA reductase-like NAD-dependent aldehyde dehydrogenase